MLHRRLLTPEEKENIYKRILHNDFSARQEIVMAYEFFIRKRAFREVRYHRLGNDALEDLVQICLEYALIVVAKYDPHLSSFSTFIGSQLRPAIDKYVSRNLQIPVKLLHARRKILTVINEQKKRGIKPTPASVRDECGVSLVHVEAVLRGVDFFQPPKSIYDPIGNGQYGQPETLVDRLVSDEIPVLEKLQGRQLAELLNQSISCLTPREQKIIRLRFAEEQTLDEVGKELFITRERVRQIEVIVLEKLRVLLRKRNIQSYEQA